MFKGFKIFELFGTELLERDVQRIAVSGWIETVLREM